VIVTKLDRLGRSTRELLGPDRAESVPLTRHSSSLGGSALGDDFIVRMGPL